MTKISLLSPGQFKIELDNYIDSYLTQQIAHAKEIGKDYAELLSELRTFTLRGGKRLRPYLAYLSYIGSDGQDIGACMQAVLSLELLHNYFLIHDDIIDRDTMRYGGPNIMAMGTSKYLPLVGDEPTAQHIGLSTALLAGDIQALLSSQAIIESKFSDGVKLSVLSEMNHIIFIEGGGEFQEMLAVHQDISEKQLEDIYRYKSSVYTIELPLRVGSLLAGKPRIEYTSFSDPLGLAFQLKDDLLGIYGNESVTGKPVLSDIQEGKKTVLMLYALRHANNTQQQVLQNALGNQGVTMQDLDDIRHILQVTKAKQYIENKIQQHATLAKQALKQLPLNEVSKVGLLELAKYIVDRKK